MFVCVCFGWFQFTCAGALACPSVRKPFAFLMVFVLSNLRNIKSIFITIKTVFVRCTHFNDHHHHSAQTNQCSFVIIYMNSCTTHARFSVVANRMRCVYCVRCMVYISYTFYFAASLRIRICMQIWKHIQCTQIERNLRQIKWKKSQITQVKWTCIWLEWWVNFDEISDSTFPMWM